MSARTSSARSSSARPSSAHSSSARSTRAVRRTARGAALVVALTTLAGALAGPAHAAHVDAKDKWPGGSTRIVAR